LVSRTRDDTARVGSSRWRSALTVETNASRTPAMSPTSSRLIARRRKVSPYGSARLDRNATPRSSSVPS
jgi:hypothetical protein